LVPLPEGNNGGIFNRSYGDGIKGKYDENDCATLLELTALPKGCTSIDIYYEYRNGRYKELTIHPDKLTKDMIGDIFLKHGRTGCFNDLVGNIIVSPTNDPDLQIELFLEEMDDGRGIGMVTTIGYLKKDSWYRNLFPGRVVPLISSIELKRQFLGRTLRYYKVAPRGIISERMVFIKRILIQLGMIDPDYNLENGFRIATHNFESIEFPNPYIPKNKRKAR